MWWCGWICCWLIWGFWLCGRYCCYNSFMYELICWWNGGWMCFLMSLVLCFNVVRIFCGGFWVKCLNILLLRYVKSMYIWGSCLFDILWWLVGMLLLSTWLCGGSFWIRMLFCVMNYVRIRLCLLWCVVVIYWVCCWCLWVFWLFMVWTLLGLRFLVELMGLLLMCFL